MTDNLIHRTWVIGLAAIATLQLAATLLGSTLAQSPAPVPTPDTWRNPLLLHTLDLAQALYHNAHCPVRIQAQAISPDSRTLAISSYSSDRTCAGADQNSTLTLWDLQTGQLTATLLQGTAMEAIFLSSDRPQEAIADNPSIAVDGVHDVKFTPDGTGLAAGLSNGTVQVWDVQTGQIMHTLRGHRYGVHAIAVSPDSQFLISGSSDQTLKIWHLQTGQLLHTLPLSNQGIMQTLLINPDGQTFVSVTTANTVQLWTLPTGQLIRTFYDHGYDHGFLENGSLPVAMSPDGQYLATGDPDYSIKLWNAHTGARVLTLRESQTRVRSLAFRPHAADPHQPTTLVSGSDDGKLRFWNLQTHQVERNLINAGVVSPANWPPINRMAFTPDGRVLVFEALLLQPLDDVIPRRGIRCWDLQQQFVYDIPEVSIAAELSISADSRYLVTTGRTTQIWEW